MSASSRSSAAEFFSLGLRVASHLYDLPQVKGVQVLRILESIANGDITLIEADSDTHAELRAKNASPEMTTDLVSGLRMLRRAEQVMAATVLEAFSPPAKLDT